LIINWYAIGATAACGLVAILIGVFLWFVIRPRLITAWYGPRIDPNSKCPACGNNKGSLVVNVVNTEKVKEAQLFVQHTCAICKAFWFEPPVLKAEKWFVPPPT
jgi:hypothetical protein